MIDLGDKGVHTYQLELAPHHSKVAMDSGKTYLGGAEKIGAGCLTPSQGQYRVLLPHYSQVKQKR